MFDQENSRNRSLAVSDKNREKQYWMDKLAGDWQKCSFPYDYRRRERGSRRVRRIPLVMETEIIQNLMKLSNRSDIRLHIILITAVVTLLSRYTGFRDIVLGMPIYKQDIEGEFINTVLILRNQLEDNMTFKELLLRMSKTTAEANEHVNFPLETLLYNLNMQISDDDFPLFDTAVLLENIHNPDHIRHLNLNMIFEFNREDNGIEGNLEYNALLYETHSVSRIAAHLEDLLKKVLTDINSRLADIDMVMVEEKRRIIEEFNRTATDYPADRSLAELFEEQVKRFPDNAAVKFEKQCLTYRDLDRLSGHLAVLLVSKGVGRNSIVGMLTDHSTEMLIGIMGILKAGAAYLPIDPEFPDSRLRYMLAESDTRLLFTQEKYVNRMAFPVETIDLGCEEIYKNKEWDSSASRSGGGDLAYVIYTSGTTGKPKGSLIEQRSVSRVVKSTNLVDLDEHDRLLLLSNYAFDGSIYDIFGALLNGGLSVIINREDFLKLEKLAFVIEEEEITSFFITSSLFNALVEERIECFRSVRKIIVGGEKVSAGHALKAIEYLGSGRLINGYGPTESTVFAIHYDIDELDEQRGTVPIGTPISNTWIYILDRQLKSLPVGALGEIYIGGDGLSRGYLNNPELTHERFVENPYMPGTSIYRTGDLGKFWPDGNIEYLGRIDDQVKLRGFRVELGEIENQLLSYNKIKEAAVLVKEDSRGSQNLCAYIVPSEEIRLADMKTFLADKLPEFMVPSQFIILEKFPLTINGKIDYRALPEPEGTRLEGQAEYEAPRNEVEKKLVEIWQETLGKKEIGIHDDFFLLGGDSIVTIQIISRMAREGYKVDMRDIFSNPTVEELAKFVKNVTRVPLQSAVSGDIPLSPNQRWFFSSIHTDPHYFNQSVILESKEGFRVEAVTAIFEKILQHHDALRISFKRRNGDIVQVNHGLEYPLSLQTLDLRQEQDAEATSIGKTNEIQGSIDLEQGPLMKLAIFRLPQVERLLIVIHHLVVDAVSWRILFEDIENLYRQYKKGETLQLPLKSDSFRLWAENLHEYADSDFFLEELNFWSSMEVAELAPIRRDFDRAQSRVKDSDSRSFELNEAETQLLLTQANQPYGTESYELLVAALGISVQQTFGNEQVVIDLEGHGREAIMEDIAVDRTVGWFTSVFPVILDLSHSSDLGRQIKEVKESIRRIPRKGIGYGLLKYVTAEENKEGMVFKLPRQISFNYLGQFDGTAAMSFGTVSESVGSQQSPAGERPFELDIWGLIVGKRLKITANFSREQYKSETIETLIHHYGNILEQIISHCVAKDKEELTPSDLTYKELTIEEVENISSIFDK